MGLFCSHGAWGSSYSSFHDFRVAIADAIGIELVKMSFGRVMKWPPTEDQEPLVALLTHSDCDGFLTPRQCGGIARRLLEILPLLEEGWVQDNARQFALGCVLAASRGEDLEFQ